MLLLKHLHILPMAGPGPMNGDILLENGKIRALGGNCPPRGPRCWNWRAYMPCRAWWTPIATLACGRTAT